MKFLISFVCAITACDCCAIEIIFHRGDASNAPENTVISIESAWKAGAQYVETDFHRTFSGEIFVFHMPYDLKRDWGWQGADTRKLTMREAEKLKYSGKFKERFSDMKLPNAEDIIATVPKNRVLVIDAKEVGDSHAFTQKIEKLRLKYGLNREQLIFITSPSHSLILNKEYPGYKSILSATVSAANGEFTNSAEDIVKTCKENGFHAVMIGHWEADKIALIPNGFIKFIKDNGIKVCIWTENATENLEKWKALGVDFICTDKGTKFLESANREHSTREK